MSPLQQQGLDDTLAYVETLQREHPLQQLFWECTLRCNMACRHCGSDCLKQAAVPDMPLDHFLAVLDEVAEHCPPHEVLVNTIGGEPLVRPDIVECGRAISERGFMWGMVTNGLTLDLDMARRLEQAGIRALSIDLDGMADDHNWLRNSPEAFDRAMQAIQAALTIPDLAFDVITCVNPRNLPHLDQLRQLLVDAGVRHWRCFTIFPAGRAARQSQLLLNPEQLRDLLNFIVSTRGEGNIDLSYSCEGFLGAYEGLVRPYYYNCQAGLTVASVRADGAIAGCLSIRSDYNQGNIYRDSFWDVWQNRFQPYRNREWATRRGPCDQCTAAAYCQGGPMHLRDQDGNLTMCHYQQLKQLAI